MNKEDSIKALERFLIDNEDFERLETELSGFNIFEAVGAVRQELRHSDFLSFILNPNKNHGLAELFLKRILIDIISKNNFEEVSVIDVQLSSFENTEVRREWRNIDLLIMERDLKLVIAFENKIDSGESTHQLVSYSKTLLENFGNEYSILKVFLTPDGISPKHDNGDWVIYSYQLISKEIEIILNKYKGTIAPKIFQLVSDYLTLLRRHIVPDQKLVELCRKIYREHSTALDLIYEYKMDIYTELQSHLIDVINGDPDVHLDDCSKTYVRFRTSVFDEIEALDNGDGWTSTKKILLYEFQNYGDNLRLKLIIGPGDSSIRKELFELSESKKDLFKGRVNKLSDRWSQILRLDVLNRSYYEELDFAAMKNRIDNFWKGFKNKEFQLINHSINEALKQ